MLLGGLLVFTIGTIIGSFLNVVVLRTNQGRSIVKGPSSCVHCHVQIKPYDMVPIISFFLLDRKCRNCKQPISWQYPLVEFSTGLIFALFFLRYVYAFSMPLGLTADLWIIFLLRDLAFMTFLIVLFVYDLRYILILDRFTFPAMVLALTFNLLLGMDPLSLLVGAAVVGGFFFIQFVISRGEWVGGGDVRMGALIGLMLGLQQGLIALFLAYMIGALVGSLLLLSGRAQFQTKIPMGTFLAVGTFIALFTGTAIMNWYLAFF